MALKVKVINGKQPSGGLGGVSDADLSNIGINFLTKGVNSANHLKVQAKGTPDMSVDVLSGIAYVFNPAGTNIYAVENDATANVVVASNASGNPRIDAMVLKIDLGVSPNNYADNVATLVRVQGTPAASPVAPTDSEIQTAIGASNPFLRLSDITVANGATSITNANIADKRVPVEFKLYIGRIKYNAATNKLQFSHDGTTYKDFGSGTAVPTFTVIGILTTGTDKCPLLMAPFALTIVRVAARVKVAPTGQALIIDINKNGTSIWNTNQSNRVQIAAGGFLGTQTNFDTTSIAQDDYLTMDIDQVGSTVAGADVTVELYCVGA